MFIMIFIIILACIIFISFIFFSVSPSPSSPSPIPSVSTLPTQRIIDNRSIELHPAQGVYQTISSAAAEQIDKDTKIGQLIKKLPHRSENFSLVYDIDTNSFIVELSTARRTQANRELDQFLQENSIMNQDWLYNLTIKPQTY
jgi:hypothetical protein